MVHTPNSSNSIYKLHKTNWMVALLSWIYKWFDSLQTVRYHRVSIMPSLLRQLIIIRALFNIHTSICLSILFNTLHKTIIGVENWEFGILIWKLCISIALSRYLSLLFFCSMWIFHRLYPIDNYKVTHETQFDWFSCQAHTHLYMYVLTWILHG